MTICKTLKQETVKSTVYPSGVTVSLEKLSEKHNDIGGYIYFTDLYCVSHSFNGINGYIDTVCFSRSGGYKAFKRIVNEYTD